MIASLSIVCSVVFCLLGARADGSLSSFTKVYNGFNVNSVIMDLTPNNLQNGNEYGIRVDIWNALAAVTAVGRSLDSNMEVGSSGAVYVYTSKNSWTWTYSTTLSSEQSEDGFGTGLAVGDSMVVVGAPFDSRWEENAGAVYIYTGVAPSFTTTTIYPDHTEKDTYFGTSVAVVNSLSSFKNGAVVVGAPGHSHEGHKQVGAVYVYYKQYGSVYFKMNMMLEPSEMKDNGQMGYSLASYGNTLAVGAPGANAAYVFELMQHVEDCPPGHEDHSNLPQGACSNYRRALQGGGGPDGGEGQGKEGEGKEGEDRDQRDHEQEEREREQREYENRHVYYAWKYEEILDIHLEDESYRDSMFGGSLAVYNDTVLTVVIGAPDMTSPTSSAAYAGAVYVCTVMNKNDLWSNFVPEGYHKEGEPHRRYLQGGDHHEEDHRHPKWDPTKNSVGWDAMDNFWLRETVIYGATAGQQFGYAVAADYKNVLIGSNNKNSFGAGSVQVYQRQATDSQDYDRPVISGPLFKRVYTLSASLSDSQGNNGDKFGTALALYKNQAIVGSYLRGLTSATNVGTGAAYVYNAIRYVQASEAPTPAPVTSSSWFTNERGHIDTSSAVTISFGATLLLLVSVLGAYGVYKYQGGKTNATVVMSASWESVKDFGASVAAKLPFRSGDSKSRVSLSSMDDSTNSVTPMNMDSSHGSTASSYSSSNAPPGRFQGQVGGSSYPPSSQSPGQQQTGRYPQQGQYQRQSQSRGQGRGQPPRSYPQQGGHAQMQGGSPMQQHQHLAGRSQPRPGQPRPTHSAARVMGPTTAGTFNQL